MNYYSNNSSNTNCSIYITNIKSITSSFRKTKLLFQLFSKIIDIHILFLRLYAPVQRQAVY
jgi:hypothetical protein